MLRPATPLTLLLLAAFVLLLLSVLSTPIVSSIPLATYGDVNFGVFGFCKGSDCSGFQIGYNPSDVIERSGNEKDDFKLPVGTRTTLSSILIIHPIAALFTLIMLVLAGASHLHSPSHSPRYLLGVFILSIITLILALLSFLIDVLLFVPHMAWGSYVVLAATLLIAASGIVSCAMRRTLVSRKARKKRIAENAEMNGENFYARQAAVPVPMTPAPAATTFVSNDDPNKADSLPAFATFEEAKETHVPAGSTAVEDDRFPLTARTRSPGSERSPDGVNAVLASGAVGGGLDRYGSQQSLRSQGGGPPRRDQYGNIIPQEMGGGPMAAGGLNRYGSNQSLDSQGRPRREPRRDQYGNIIPPPTNYSGQMRGERGDPRGYGGGPGGYGRGRGGGPGGYRGRGGPGGPGGRGPRRDQYGNIIPPPPGYDRGGPGGPGGYGRGGYSNRAPSPMDYAANNYSQSTIQSGPYDAPPPAGRRGPGRGGYSNRAPSPMDYGGYDQSQSTLQSGPYGSEPTARSGSAPLPDDNYYGNNAPVGNAYGGPGPRNPPLMVGQQRPDSLARAESPPPMDDLPPSLAVGGPGSGRNSYFGNQQGGGQGGVGQAIEMDATTGSRSPAHAPEGYGQSYGRI